MNFRLKRNLLVLALTQFFIFILSFITYKKVSLFSYINISFYVSSSLLLTSLLLYTIQNGFFDVIARSFNMFFSRGHGKRTFSEIPNLSEMVTINRKPLLLYGLINASLMVLALFVYYF